MPAVTRPKEEAVRRDDVVACSLNPQELDDRRREWERLAESALQGRTLTDGGQQLVFRCDDEVEETLRRLAQQERECCAFADWKIDVSDGTVVLDVSSRSDEGVAAVQAMFSRFASRAPR